MISTMSYPHLFTLLAHQRGDNVLKKRDENPVTGLMPYPMFVAPTGLSVNSSD